MPRTSRPPSYRLPVERSGQAVVTIHGKDHYLGPHGSAKSREVYAHLIAQSPSMAKRNQTKFRYMPPENGQLSMLELLAAFWLHVEEYYVGRNGRRNQEQINFHTLIKRLRCFAGEMQTAEFRPESFASFATR